LEAILRKVWKVPGPPADHREAERHRLSPDRPVRLARSGKDEDVGRFVEGGDVLRGERPVPYDTADEVDFRKASPHARSIPCIGRLVAGEVERPQIGRQPRESLEHLKDSFAGQPVGDREEGRSAPVTEVPHGTYSWRCHVAPGRDNSNARLREPAREELLREVVARGEEDVRSPQREPVQRRLYLRASDGVVDAAGRLVQNCDQRNTKTADRQRRTYERSCDRIEKDGARAELLRLAEHHRPTESGERERPLRKREKADPRLVRRSRLRHSQVIEIATAQAAGIAECDQRENEMRVVHVAPTLFGPAGIFGGGERYPLELARALARQVDCELVSFDREARVWSDSGRLRIRTLRSVTHFRGHPAQPLGFGLGRALSEADIVHAHQLRSAPSRLVALQARIRRIPTVVTDHGLAGGNWAGLLPRLFDRFLTVSAYSARELAAPASRTRVVYGGADPDRFWPDAEVRRRGVLFVGRLTPHKGVDRLIEALPEDAELRVVGSAGHDANAPERDYPKLLRSLAAQRHVAFLGALRDADLPAIYRSAQVLALPSVHVTRYGREVRVSELLSLTCIEAMASGTPIVASSLGGVPEVVEDGVTGFLVEPGNIEALRERLAQVLGDALLAEQLGRSARERFLEEFTWEACAARCLSAYSELVSS